MPNKYHYSDALYDVLSISKISHSKIQHYWLSGSLFVCLFSLFHKQSYIIHLLVWRTRSLKGVITDIWLKYWQYGEKLYPINQSKGYYHIFLNVKTVILIGFIIILIIHIYKYILCAYSIIKTISINMC